MRTYRTNQGDTWDLIAYRMYGNEFKSPLLLEANGAHREIVIFPEGVLLEVPKLAGDDLWLSDAPPWRDVE